MPACSSTRCRPPRRVNCRRRCRCRRPSRWCASSRCPATRSSASIRRSCSTLLDGFFGGSGRATGDPQAAIAPAAQRFLALMIRSLAADVSAAWAPVTPVEIELVKQETNPQFVQLGEPLDTVIVAKFKRDLRRGTRGGLDWLLPESLLAPVRETLASDGSPRAVRPKEDWAPSLRRRAAGRRDRGARDSHRGRNQPAASWCSLSPGDVIPDRHPADGHAARRRPCRCTAAASASRRVTTPSRSSQEASNEFSRPEGRRRRRRRNSAIWHRTRVPAAARRST